MEFVLMTEERWGVLAFPDGGLAVLTASSHPRAPHRATRICINTCSFLGSVFYYIDPLVCLHQHFSVLTVMAPLAVLTSGKPICGHFQGVLVRPCLFQTNYGISLAHSKISDISVCVFIHIWKYTCVSVCIYSCVCVSACVSMLLCVEMCPCLSVFTCSCMWLCPLSGPESGDRTVAIAHAPPGSWLLKMIFHQKEPQSFGEMAKDWVMTSKRWPWTCHRARKEGRVRRMRRPCQMGIEAGGKACTDCVWDGPDRRINTIVTD